MKTRSNRSPIKKTRRPDIGKRGKPGCTVAVSEEVFAASILALPSAVTESDLPDSSDATLDAVAVATDPVVPKLEADLRRGSDPILHVYLREIGKVPLLTEQEELALVKRVRRGDEVARESMIKANLRLVVHIARRYQDFGLPLLDLISEGNIGLMKAVDRFDPSHGRRLSSYAGIWITQRIRRALADQGKLIRLPVHQVERLIHLRRSAVKLQSELGREPTDEEIAEQMRLPASKIKRLRSAALTPASLDAALGEQSDDTLASVISDEQGSTPEEAATIRGERDYLCAAIGSLSPREVIVLTERFGLDDGTVRTLEEVGTTMGLTRERIRQIQNRALAKLRRRLASRHAGVTGLWASYGK